VEALAEKVRGQNDPLSIKSIEVIIDGLKRIQEVNAIAREKETARSRYRRYRNRCFPGWPAPITARRCSRK